MKRIILLCCLALLAASCGNDTQQIRQVAQGYLDAMGNYRPTDARPYSTQQTCDQTLAFFEVMMQHTDPAVYANNIPAEITLGDILVDDTVATVNFHKHTPSMEQDGTIRVVKRDRTWLVDEVIQVPAPLRAVTDTNFKGHQFTDEEIAEMRRSRADHSVHTDHIALKQPYGRE